MKAALGRIWTRISRTIPEETLDQISEETSQDTPKDALKQFQETWIVSPIGTPRTIL